MKLLRFGPCGPGKTGCAGYQGAGAGLSAVVSDIAGSVLLPEGLARLRDLELDDLPLVEGVPQQDLRLGPCVGQVGKCICIGLNYADTRGGVWHASAT